METNKVIIVVTDERDAKYSTSIRLRRSYNRTREEWVAALDKLHKAIYPNETIVAVYDAHYYHICKYCGNVTQGDFEDFLCEDCRMLFGHSCFSEL